MLKECLIGLYNEIASKQIIYMYCIFINKPSNTFSLPDSISNQTHSCIEDNQKLVLSDLIQVGKMAINKKQ